MGKGEATRQKILEHAIDLARRVGLEGLSIGRLAEDLHLSKSGLFAHFKSKENLQIQVLEEAAAQFVDAVVKPALTAPRGEARFRALFERWLQWTELNERPGGCLFVAAAVELDDRPGPVRERLVQLQKDWLDMLAQATRIAVQQGHFRSDIDPEQLAHDTYGIALAYHHASRLLRDPKAKKRAHQAFESLVGAARRSRRAS